MRKLHEISDNSNLKVRTPESILAPKKMTFKEFKDEHLIDDEKSLFIKNSLENHGGWAGPSPFTQYLWVDVL